MLIREGEYARTLGQIYSGVIQMVILFRSDNWVMKPRIERFLEKNHHRVALRVALRVTGGGATLERKGRRMVISPAVVSDDGGGIEEGGDLYIPPPEHSQTFYCDQDHYGPVSEGVEEAGVKGFQAVVGSGWTGFGGYMDVGSGGGTNRGFVV